MTKKKGRETIVSTSKKSTVNLKAAAAAAATPSPAAPPTAPPLAQVAASQAPGAITIPLTPVMRAAYQALYDQYETSIESTTDPNLLQALNDSQDAVGDLLEQDAEYALNQNTAAYKALQTQITTVNTSLKALLKKLTAIAGGVQTFGTILNALNKVLTLVGA